MEQITALLPMKGHSERVPNKNLKHFAGKPLYHAILRTLLDCSLVREVVINTDSETIKADATKNFETVRIIDRPEALIGDYVSMNRIIEYDLQHLEGKHFLQTHSTNPLLRKKSLEEGIKKYFSLIPGYDSVFSVTRWQTRLYWSDGRAINHNPEELLRTQDLPPVMEENSNFYIFSKSSFQESGGKRIGLRPFLFETPRLESLDIDEQADFEIAEFLYKQTRNA